MFTYGRNSTTGCTGEYHPEVEIGNFTRIGVGTIFYGNANYPSINNPEAVANFCFNHHMATSYYHDMGGRGKITIGNDVWIGVNCAILSGVTIGDGAIIGMHTVVSKDVPPYAVAVGSPMVIKRYRFPQDIIDKLLKIKWWEWDDKTIRERVDNRDFNDVNKFIEKYG